MTPKEADELVRALGDDAAEELGLCHVRRTTTRDLGPNRARSEVQFEQRTLPVQQQAAIVPRLLDCASLGYLTHMHQVGEM
jgi:hypothetical protein